MKKEAESHMLEDSKIHKENCEKLKKSEEDSRMILKKLTDHEKLSKDINEEYEAKSNELEQAKEVNRDKIESNRKLATELH